MVSTRITLASAMSKKVLILSPLVAQSDPLRYHITFFNGFNKFEQFEILRGLRFVLT
jgi:hypothetical protein